MTRATLTRFALIVLATLSTGCVSYQSVSKVTRDSSGQEVGHEETWKVQITPAPALPYYYPDPYFRSGQWHYLAQVYGVRCPYDYRTCHKR